MSRHDGRNRVLIDELRMAITAQQDTEIIEPRHDALQLDTIDEENGERDFVLPNEVEKSIL